MEKSMQKKDIIEESWVFLYKYGSWIAWVILGLIGRFSYDLYRKRRFTTAYIMACTGMALVVGYVGGIYIFAHYPDDAPMLVPMLTLLSNNIISALMSINWTEIMRKNWKEAFEVLLRKKV